MPALCACSSAQSRKRSPLKPIVCKLSRSSSLPLSSLQQQPPYTPSPPFLPPAPLFLFLLLISLRAAPHALIELINPLLRKRRAAKTMKRSRASLLRSVPQLKKTQSQLQESNRRSSLKSRTRQQCSPRRLSSSCSWSLGLCKTRSKSTVSVRDCHLCLVQLSCLTCILLTRTQPVKARAAPPDLRRFQPRLLSPSQPPLAFF